MIVIYYSMNRLYFDVRPSSRLCVVAMMLENLKFLSRIKQIEAHGRIKKYIEVINNDSKMESAHRTSLAFVQEPKLRENKSGNWSVGRPSRMNGTSQFFDDVRDPCLLGLSVEKAQ